MTIEHKKGQQVEVYMGFRTVGTYEGFKGGKHLVFLTDPQCGLGIFQFTQFIKGAYCTDKYPTP